MIGLFDNLDCSLTTDYANKSRDMTVTVSVSGTMESPTKTGRKVSLHPPMVGGWPWVATVTVMIAAMVVVAGMVMTTTVTTAAFSSFDTYNIEQRRTIDKVVRTTFQCCTVTDEVGQPW